MSATVQLDDDGRTATARLPLAFRKRGSRKVVVAPESGAKAGPPVTPTLAADSALVRALARAFRWRKLLENGGYTTIREIARAEGINESYICRTIRLTLLAPSDVDAIVESRQPKDLTLGRLLRAPSTGEWGAFWQADDARFALEAVVRGGDCGRLRCGDPW